MARYIEPFHVRLADPGDTEIVSRLCEQIQSKKSFSNDHLVTRLAEYIRDRRASVYLVLHQHQLVCCLVIWDIPELNTIQLSDFRILDKYKQPIETAHVVTSLMTNGDVATSQPMRVCVNEASPDERPKDNLLTERISVFIPLYRYFKSGPRVVQSNLDRNNPGALELVKQIREADHSELQALLEEGHSAKLFPDGKIFLNNVVHSVAGHAPEVMTYYPLCYVSKSATMETDALSLGARISSADGRGWLYDMHYHGDANLDLLLAHVYKHTQCAFADPIRFNVNFNVMLPVEFEREHDAADLKGILARTFSSAVKFAELEYLQATIIKVNQLSKI